MFVCDVFVFANREAVCVWFDSTLHNVRYSVRCLMVQIIREIILLEACNLWGCLFTYDKLSVERSIEMNNMCSIIIVSFVHSCDNQTHTRCIIRNIIDWNLCIEYVCLAYTRWGHFARLRAEHRVRVSKLELRYGPSTKSHNIYSFVFCSFTNTCGHIHKKDARTISAQKSTQSKTRAQPTIETTSQPHIHSNSDLHSQSNKQRTWISLSLRGYLCDRERCHKHSHKNTLRRFVVCDQFNAFRAFRGRLVNGLHSRREDRRLAPSQVSVESDIGLPTTSHNIANHNNTF